MLESSEALTTRKAFSTRVMDDEAKFAFMQFLTPEYGRRVKLPKLASQYFHD